MDKIIIYGGKYGTAEAYAKALSERTGVRYADHKTIRRGEKYSEIIYIGSLYAGNVAGLTKTLKKLGIDGGDGTKLIIATVGLADPENSKNAERIRASVKRQIPERAFKTARLAHLRGGIDYSRLGFIHRLMMKFLCASLKKKPDELRTAEDTAIIETYGKTIDFTDLSALDRIVEII